ncbi:MAG: LURP-one-related/scramblase family protein [Acidimicrobiales bacterium]
MTDPLFESTTLVVSQKAKLIELQNEYAVYDADANQIGLVRQVGQTALKKVARFVSSLDQFMTHELEVVDAAGAVRLKLVRPRKFVKSKVEVSDGSGRPIGKIVQLNMMGKIRFGLEDANGTQVGSLNGQNWRAWDFSIQDASGREVANIKKTWEGLAKTLFTTADNYRVTRNEITAEPLNSLVLAASLAIDTALKQDSRGLG